MALAACALPGLALTQSECFAQVVPQESMVQFKYAYYRDYQGGPDRNRMKVISPMAYGRTMIADNLELEGTIIYDSMSGASPLYYSTLSGASGKGISDNRVAGDVKTTKYFENFSVSIGGVVSDEDDYLSRGGLIETSFWGDDKNTTYSLGVSTTSDQITSTNNDELFEKLHTWTYQAGVTQVLSENSIIQTNLSYQNYKGYQTDPYKAYDNRPEGRDGWAWLTRYRHFLDNLDAAVHADYRLYTDTWGLVSNMINLAWYQQVGENWMVRPSVRLYAQNAADFFLDSVPPQNFDQFMTADQRLGAFGSIGLGLKVERNIAKGLSVDVSFNFEQQRNDWRLSGPGNSDITTFSMYYLLFGFTKRFD